MKATATFGPAEARRHYDRFAHRQDGQAWYEDAALRHLLIAGSFERAESVVEAGCGTGRFASWLLGGPLPAKAIYTGVDISSAMLDIAAPRLAAHSPRAGLIQANAAGFLPLAPQCCDRFVATYLLDLLTPGETARLLDEAHRLLRPGGLICLASLTCSGPTVASRLIGRILGTLRGLSPARLGGCRPIPLASLLDPPRWRRLGRSTHSRFGVASETIVALKC